MPARRCATCKIDWPSAGDFLICPVCGERCEYEPLVASPMSFDHARKRAQFERIYRERERERERRGDPSPEALGALEARRQIAQIRELDRALGV